MHSPKDFDGCPIPRRESRRPDDSVEESPPTLSGPNAKLLE